MFSNAACVEARNKPWYAAVIVGILSVFLAVLPISINYFNQQGGDILNTPNYGIDNGLVAFQESLEDNNVSVKIGDGSVEITGWDEAYGANERDAYYTIYTKTETYIPVITSVDESSSVTTSYGDAATREVKCCDLIVFNCASMDDSTLSTYINDTVLPGVDITGNATYSVNSLFLGQDSFVVVKNPSGSSSYTGRTYKYSLSTPVDLASFTKQDLDGNTYDVKRSDVAADKNNVDSYYESSLQSWKQLLSACWNDTRITSGWTQTGIMAAIFVGVTFFMGLMIFVMTRGKTNPFRSYTFWQTQKIAYWAAFTPALIAMIGTFVYASWAMLYYIFAFGMRVMWMSMRTLRPYQQ
jgi:hypothetical protein